MKGEEDSMAIVVLFMITVSLPIVSAQSNLAVGPNVRTSMSHETDPAYVGGATNGNDGDPGRGSEADCVRTISGDDDDFRWFRIDLGQVYKVTSVVIVTGKFTDDDYATTGIEIRVATSIPEATKAIQTRFEKSCKKLGPAEKLAGAYSSHTLTCAGGGIVGQYVTLLQGYLRKRVNGQPVGGQGAIAHPLAFCEIRVFGNTLSGNDVPGPGRPCAGGCLQNTVCQDNVCKIVTGRACDIQTDKTHFCNSNATCDHGVCRLKLKQPCNEQQPCITAATCDNTRTCKTSVGHKCTDNSECEAVSVCNSICGKPPGRSCSTNDDCVPGANCDRGGCECNTAVSDFTAGTTVCTVKAGYATASCTADADCTTPSTVCLNRKCDCAQAKILSYRDYSCRLGAGGSCANDIDCSTGSTCQDGQCKLLVNERCSGPNCATGLLCDNNVCKRDVDQPCTTFRSVCKTGSECVNRKCRLQLGFGDCSSDTHCITQVQGTLCHTASKKCLIGVGHNCQNELSQYCIPTAVCDTDAICKNKIGYPCTGQKDCLTGLACESSTCKKGFGSKCSSSDECASQYKCDSSGHCKVPERGPCKKDLDCVSGATCSHSSSSCACDGKISTASNGLCNPLAGRILGLCKSGACEVANAECTGRCRCKPSFAVNVIDYSCGIAPGESCGESTLKCEPSSVCDSDNKCRIAVGGDCSSAAGMCFGLSTCMDGICKNRPGGNCTNLPKSCAGATACDPTGICRLRVGTPCIATLEGNGGCVAGATCIRMLGAHTPACHCNKTISTLHPSEGYCVPLEQKVLGVCDTERPCESPTATCEGSGNNNSVCVCGQGTDVDFMSFTCKNAPKTRCESKDSCVSGTVCLSGVCKVALGYSCVGLEDACMVGTVCDSLKTCKLDYGQSCATLTDTDGGSACREGAYCDILSMCKIENGQSCKDLPEDVCVAGAACVGGVCTCTAGVSTVAGIACEAKAGRVTGSCVQDSCHDPNADCSEGRCLCKKGFITHAMDFTCHSARSDNTSDAGSLVGILLGALTAFLIIIVVCIVIGQRKLQKEKTDIVAQVRRQSVQVARLSMHVNQIPPPQPSVAASSMVESSRAESSYAESSHAESSHGGYSRAESFHENYV